MFVESIFSMEEEEAETQISQSKTQSTGQTQQHGEEQDQNVLNFLDSMDRYVVLIDSLSSILRQGWLELASARHSMGGSRINSSLLDLKHHSAATALEVNYDDVGTAMKSPQFTLCKWASPDIKDSSFEKANIEEDELKEKSSSPKLQHQDTPQFSEYPENSQETNGSNSNGSPRTVDYSLQKERAKLLSMFGTLVSPKLRASQLSFETALETLVEIANMRSSILHAYDKVQKEMGSTTG